MIQTQLYWYEAGQCLHKSQNLLQRAYLWVCISPHEKTTKWQCFLCDFCNENVGNMPWFVYPTLPTKQHRGILVKKWHESAKMYDTAKMNTAQSKAMSIFWGIIYIIIKGQKQDNFGLFKVAEDDVTCNQSKFWDHCILTTMQASVVSCKRQNEFLCLYWQKITFLSNFEQKMLHPPGWPIVGSGLPAEWPFRSQNAIEASVACG